MLILGIIFAKEVGLMPCRMPIFSVPAIEVIDGLLEMMK